MIFKCKLYAYSNSGHLQQLFAGFNTLAKNGYLSLDIDTSYYSATSTTPLLKLQLNNKINAIYDTNDGYNFSYNTLDENIKFLNKLLSESDYYFKRSFCPAINQLTDFDKKIYPLGLNYGFDFSVNDRFIQNRLQKTFSQYIIQKLRDSKYHKLFGIFGDYKLCDQRFIEFIPHITDNPKVLFIARLWDPRTANCEKAKDEWVRLNEFRMDNVRLMKREFKDKFIGGIIEDSYSNIICADLKMPPAKTRRSKFIELVHDAEICVTTTGLHNSIGWKFAEYVASSRAIVTEPLHYKLPGNFFENENYCVFNSPEGCIEQVAKLMSNKSMRLKLMKNNFYYYNNFVRPDSLVLNSLYTIVENEVKKEALRIY